MGRYKTKSEGGQGGKVGHSNMEHWDETEVIKESARKERRINDSKEITDQLRELKTERSQHSGDE